MAPREKELPGAGEVTCEDLQGATPCFSHAPSLALQRGFISAERSSDPLACVLPEASAPGGCGVTAEAHMDDEEVPSSGKQLGGAGRRVTPCFPQLSATLVYYGQFLH